MNVVRGPAMSSPTATETAREWRERKSAELRQRWRERKSAELRQRWREGAQPRSGEPRVAMLQEEEALVTGYWWGVEEQREALPDPEKLELLADWLDTDDVVLRRGPGHDLVQRDLRMWATKARALLDKTGAQG